MFRKILISTVAAVAVSGTAFAADLPSRSAPPVYIPPPPIFTWAGFYIGGQVGYEFGTAATNISGAAGTVGIGSTHPDGVVGGAHVGYNYQFSQFVVGIEGDVNGSDYKGSGGFTAFGGGNQSTRIDLDGSIRGRVGYAWDRALIYATGGAAFGQNHHTIAAFGGGVDRVETTRVGWTVGGGVEYAITNNWSIRAEYRYTDYGNTTNVLFNSSIPSGSLVARSQDTDHRVQGGFSYKFDTPVPMAPPIVAKY